VASTPAATGSGDLGAPLYIAWQVTNECDLACLHCIEESGPGKAFHDELSDEDAFRFLEQVMDLDVPYLSFSGGEPMVHPRFFDMVQYICSRNGQLKIETNGHSLSPENCERLKALGVKAVQVSLDGASRETFNRMRVRGDYDRALEGVRNLLGTGLVELAGGLLTSLIALVDLPPSRATASPLGAPLHGMRSRPGTGWRRQKNSTRRISRCSTPRSMSTAAACGSISTRWGCLKSCATACTTRRRCSSFCRARRVSPVPQTRRRRQR
jgi:hypothetical protein